MSSAYYIERARRPRNCWDCDGVRRCRCTTAAIRSVKRGAKAVWRARMAEEVREPSMEVYAEMAANHYAMDLAFGGGS